MEYGMSMTEGASPSMGGNSSTYRKLWTVDGPRANGDRKVTREYSQEAAAQATNTGFNPNA